jgi:hypothetical protein
MFFTCDIINLIIKKNICKNYSKFVVCRGYFWLWQAARKTIIPRALLLLSKCINTGFTKYFKNEGSGSSVPGCVGNLHRKLCDVYRGQIADIGTERIGEDGAAGTKDAAMGTLSNVRVHGIFKTAAGPLLLGESAQFSFNASLGDSLQFETMFVQSNDWFYSFRGGIGLQLFNGDTPITSDVTSALRLYDAGTEKDTPLGTGPDQKPVQATHSQGSTESIVITGATVRHPTFIIPATNTVIKVTITAN